MIGKDVRHQLVYICNNNGSDVRIAKEILTLSRDFDVHFVGFGSKKHHSVDPGNLASYMLVPGNIRSIGSLYRLFKILRSLLRHHLEATVHVVNEQLLVLLAPVLLGRFVVLDSFDSIFLRMNLPGNRLATLKCLVYGLPRKIIVTDKNRYDLLPNCAKGKAEVVPNVPRLAHYPCKRVDSEYLTICYFGSLAERRGSRFIRGLLDADRRVRCLAAGWIADDYTETLMADARVQFLGSLPQEKVNAILAEKGDYLVAVYPLINQNNMNASPNKVFDALHTRTPIIITRGVKVAADVVASNFGLEVDTGGDLDYRTLVRVLMERRETFSFPETAILDNSWERFENRLLATHGFVPQHQG